MTGEVLWFLLVAVILARGIYAAWTAGISTQLVRDIYFVFVALCTRVGWDT